MAGAVIENLSNKKLFGVLFILLVVEILFVALGAVFSPDPSSSMEFLMTKCKDENHGTTSEWFFIRPPNHCDKIDQLEGYKSTKDDARDIVFVAQMPHARSGISLEYSAWFQFLIGYLEVEIPYNPSYNLSSYQVIHMEIRMASRMKEDQSTKWTEYISTTIQRTLECHIDADKAVHQNGGFTTIWLWLKTIVSPVIIVATWWYYKRVEALNRPKLLIEKSILALGCALIVLDFPIEWISLWCRLPAMLLINDLRQGIFYAILFSFWLIFAGEHLIDDTTRNNLKNYWRNLSLVCTASLALLVYDLSERGRHLIDPFFSLWASPRGTFWAQLAIYGAAVTILIYFLFLSFKIWQVWTTIKRKRAAQLYNMNKNRRIKVEAIIYRFKFLMILTMVCALLTIVSYFMQQYDEGQISDENVEQEYYYTTSKQFTHSASAFFTGTFGMWNIYVVLLLCMYAPSHKHYANAQVLEDENEDLMNPNSNTHKYPSGSTTEYTPMTTFLLKSATD